jgi:hypothetical protein
MVEIWLFTVRSDIYSSLGALLDQLSSPLLIAPIDASRISELNRIVRGHQYRQYGRSRSTLADLTNPSYRFSDAHHPAPYMFVHPDVPISWDVSECQVLCYEPPLIPTIATLRRRVFTFLLLKEQFDRIGSTVRVQFFAAFNSQQFSAFPSRYDRKQLYLLDHLARRLGDLPFPDMRTLVSKLPTKFVNGQKFHCDFTVVPYCFEECLITFVASHLVTESETICLRQWMKSCLIPSSN